MSNIRSRKKHDSYRPGALNVPMPTLLVSTHFTSHP